MRYQGKGHARRCLHPSQGTFRGGCGSKILFGWGSIEPALLGGACRHDTNKTRIARSSFSRFELHPDLGDLSGKPCDRAGRGAASDGTRFDFIRMRRFERLPKAAFGQSSFVRPGKAVRRYRI